jgi:alpha,alpha-trehalase
MCLPERAVQGQSYDYRYAWLRDQCYAGSAAAAAGLDDLLDAAVRFVGERVLADGPRLRPVYAVDGASVPAERPLRLRGYPGGRDVVGNRAGDQSQLDVLGEVLQLFAAAGARDRLDADGRQALLTAARVVEESWQSPDAGIWELEPDWWAQSRLACVAGLRQVAALGGAAASGGRRPTAEARWAGLADAILAETTRRCLHPDGHWQRSPTLSGVDASLLRPPVQGAVPADDPRTRATLEVVLRDLEDDGFVYRFASPDHPAGTVEGAFLLCGFMVSRAMTHQGRHVEAARWFERTRAACGSPGLFTEEYDVRQRQLRGNLPQAFVHAAALETAAGLVVPPPHDAVPTVG